MLSARDQRGISKLALMLLGLHPVGGIVMHTWKTGKGCFFYPPHTHSQPIMGLACAECFIASLAVCFFYGTTWLGKGRGDIFLYGPSTARCSPLMKRKVKRIKIKIVNRASLAHVPWIRYLRRHLGKYSVMASHLLICGSK